MDVVTTITDLVAVCSGIVIITAQLYRYQSKAEKRRLEEGQWKQDLSNKVQEIEINIQTIDNSGGFISLLDSVKSHDKFISENRIFVQQVNDRLTALETKIDVFWSNLDKYFGSIAHSPHTPDLDEFLDRWKLGVKFSQKELNGMYEELSKTEKEFNLSDSKSIAIQYLKARIRSMLEVKSP